MHSGRKRTREHWPSRKYSVGYIYNRGGVAYINIAGYKKSTGLRFVPQNRKAAVDLLDAAVVQYFQPKAKKASGENKRVSDLIQEYSKVHFPNISKSWRYSIKRAVKYCITHDYPLSDVEAIRIEIAENLAAMDYHPNYIRKCAQCIRQIFTYAIGQGYMSINPVTANMIPRKVSMSKKQDTLMTIGEINKIINHLRTKGNIELARLVEFIRITGCRIGEVLKIKWSDIGSESIKIDGKGSRIRYFPIRPFPELEKLLSEMPRSREELFPWKNYTKLSDEIQSAKKYLGIEKSGVFHSIRAARENELINDERIDMNIAAELLGHTRRVQEEHYLEALGPKKLAELIMRNRSK
ncbi:MAG: tyrosine-type recombinase/integrase [Candidatus Kapaibacterium sp.]